MSPHAPHDLALGALLTAVGGVVDRAAGADDRWLARASGRGDLTAAEVLEVVHRDLQQLVCDLVMGGAAAPGRLPVRCDTVTVVAPDEADDDRWVRVVAAARPRRAAVLRDLARLADAASAAAVVLHPGAVHARGGIVCTGDLMEAWASRVQDRLADLPGR